jgi:hypothetical protein
MNSWEQKPEIKLEMEYCNYIIQNGKYGMGLPCRCSGSLRNQATALLL